jgi:uncharacterized protein
MRLPFSLGAPFSCGKFHGSFMKTRLLLAFFAFALVVSTCAADPLRIFLRGGPKTHGPAGNGIHEHERWMHDWTKLLADRGAKVEGALKFPTGEQLENTDVLVMYAAESGTIAGQDRENLEKFLKRGGGIVSIHDAVCGTHPEWFKTIIGGAWEHRHSKWFEGEVSFYYVDTAHPITDGCSNFDFEDEVYWDLHMMPGVRVLGASWGPTTRNTRGGRLQPHIYDIIPQLWVYENALEGGAPYRSFVSIPGHQYKTFQLPHFRAVLLRGIAWAGKRDVDLLCTPEELATLRYPEGGPTAPEKAAAHLDLHPEFDMNLVAAEPLINKPIALDWDPSGRLWVAETPEYPNGRRGIPQQHAAEAWKDSGALVNQAGVQDRPAQDRISILVDTTGDGRADKKEIFYEGLELVTGFVFYRDGVIASAAPDIWWLRDTTGDGKADKVEKIYTGLGHGDTHAVINNLRWGFDGWIYATHGYSAGNVKSADGSVDFGRMGSGVVRFKPDGSAFEQYSSKGGNTWGLDVAWDNEIFFTQPTSGDLLNHVVLPEQTLALGRVGKTPSFKAVIRGRKSNPLIKWEHLAYMQIDVVGGFTAASGGAIYDGGAWPSEWNYSYFTTEPTINLVHHEVVTPDGVTFTAKKTREEEFIGGRDLWYRPIETRIGPDGALYILDFYNQAVIHNDTRGPRHNAVNAAVRPDRDHYFGRIFRVQHKQAKKLEIPDLAKASPEQLLKALEHPNQHVRMNAHRLLVEKSADVEGALKRTLSDAQASDRTKVHALWILKALGKIDRTTLVAAFGSPSPAVQKNVFRVAAENPTPGRLDVRALLSAITDPQVRLQAIVALGALPPSKELAEAVLEIFPEMNDPWLESAAVGIAARAPVEFLDAALDSRNPEGLRAIVAQLSSQVAAKQDPADVSRVLIAMAPKPASSDALKVVVLENFVTGLRPDTAPQMTAQLRKALSQLVASSSERVALAALPLSLRWNAGAGTGGEVQTLISKMLAGLNDASQSEALRGEIAAGLIGIREANAEILPAVGGMLGSLAPSNLQRRIIEALGATGDPAVGPIFAAAYANLSTQLQETAFAQITRRADWSLALVEALRNGQVTLVQLGPPAVHRLRTHPDAAVAGRAREVVEQLRGPEAKEKEALIAKLTPEVVKPGNVEKGGILFEQNCIICHRFNGKGGEAGPDLSGMGAHGPAELLVATLDPNREVDPSFVAWNIETKNDESYDGIIVSENPTTITLRNNTGDTLIRVADIASRRNTGRSLMPEGFEALGAEGLRDLLAYMSEGDSKFRIIDLRNAFTADSTKGIYNTQESVSESLLFTKFGMVKAGDVPFEIIHPSRTLTGNNVVVLRGGSGFAKTLPQKTEISNVNLRANRLHFLGGVAGWGWPFGGDAAKGLHAGKITVHFLGGQTQEFILTNGVEVADYNGRSEVPGSRFAPGIVSRGQVRTFSRDVRSHAPIEKITLESANNSVAPTFVAITAEIVSGAAAGAQPAAATTAVVAKAESSGNNPRSAPIQVLIMGGGSAHDYPRWFDKADTATLNEAGLASARYTDNPDEILPALPTLDVLYLSNNKPIPDPLTRKGIFDFVESGKGLLLVHAGLWYNWRDWPEYNRILAGGGSRGHDRLGEFEVKVTNPSHPVMQGVPETFKIIDELYWFEQDLKGSEIEVLATAHSRQMDKTYPQVFIVKHPKARIVAITLGHDGRAHEHEVYKTLLRNSLRWVAEGK